jgi:uncharacterized protein (TIGR04141 family)
VDVQSLNAVPVHSRSQASVATNLDDFGIDIEQDIIFAAIGSPKNPSLGKQIAGKDSVKINIPFDLDDLPMLLEMLLEAYESVSYKDRFSWIDNLSEVRDPGLCQKLDGELEKKIVSKNLERTWLAVPSIIDLADSASFKYQNSNNKDSVHDDIDWASYLEFVGDAPKTVEMFRKHHVMQIIESSGYEKESWSVYQCIYCELELDSQLFALNNGKWYRINKDFLKKLNEVVLSIPISKLSMPDYKEANERDYNRHVYESNVDYYALMDRKNIRYGGGSSQIEFCDLYTTEKHLIHVKRYNGSSVLSHLFSQGLVTARLLLSDADFRREVNKHLPNTHRFSNPAIRPNADDYTVIYAMISNAKKEKFELPLFSKINLRNCYSQLQAMGLHIGLCVIPVASANEKTTK